MTDIVNMAEKQAQVSLEHILNDYDVVDVNGDAIVVTQKLSDPSMREIGYTGETAWGTYMREEYLPELRGSRGLQAYDRMRRNDAQVRMSMRLVKTPILGARWYMEPASDSPQDRKVAEFVWNCMTKYMSISFPQIISEALLMMDFGWYSFEKVFAMRNGQLVWKKFAPRHPLDLEEWVHDAHGGPKALRFYGPIDAFDSVRIPIEKMLVFTFDKEGGNMEGVSALRSAYKHWYFKENLYKIDAIQKERHGIGIPIIKLPAGFTPQDRAIADNLGRNLRTNEKAHVVLPPMWEIVFAKLEGQPVNCLESIAHHDMQITRNILAPFMNDEAGDTQELFMKGTRYIAETIRDVFNKYAINELVRLNFGEDVEPPELRVRRIGETVDWRTLSFAIRNLIGAGVIQPDERLDAWIRDEMDLPRADPNTVRETATPQAPSVEKPKAGPPRQATTAGKQNTPGNANAGKDGSGKAEGN